MQAKKHLRNMRSLDTVLGDQESPEIAIPVTMAVMSEGENSGEQIHGEGLVVLTNRRLHYVRAGRRSGDLDYEAIRLSDITSMRMERVRFGGMYGLDTSEPEALAFVARDGARWLVFGEDESRGLLREECAERQIGADPQRTREPRKAILPDDVWPGAATTGLVGLTSDGLFLDEAGLPASWFVQVTALGLSCEPAVPALLAISPSELWLVSPAAERKPAGAIRIPFSTIVDLTYRQRASGGEDRLALQGPLNSHYLELRDAQYTQAGARPYPGQRPLDALAGVIGDAICGARNIDPEWSQRATADGQRFSLRFPKPPVDPRTQRRMGGNASG